MALEISWSVWWSLIKIAADRAIKKGLVFLPPEFLWDTFCSRFPYQETDDQANAILDVLSDLSSGRPMDRLICGDVGFGKTEVALRAAFVVASSSKQVAIITPTTLLSRQHNNNFKERFRGLPFEIQQLSRFVSKGKALLVKEGLKQGTTDIVIGTHALLSEKITNLRGPIATVITGRNVDMSMYTSIINGRDIELGNCIIRGQKYQRYNK